MKERSWDKLTEVQKKALSPILCGNNTLIIAPTGYGKTEAALLPVLSQMIDTRSSPVSLIYVTPLKALINDITLRIEWWSSRLGFTVSRKHGEVPQKEKNMRLKRAPHILVTTPEGLEIDLDWASKFREFYKNVKWVIIDEIHELINSKRGVQLAVLLERLKAYSGYDFQRIGLSATIANEDVVASFLSGSSSRKATVVKVNDSKSFKLKIRKIKGEEVWSNSAKELMLSIEPPTLVFTNSRFLTERLHEELDKLNVKGVFVHHSSISRESKSSVEEALRIGKVRAVICTKTLELGIDVGDIKKIIMYRPPPSVASFLQRLGRSGHYVHGVPSGEILCVYPFDVLEAIAIYQLAKRGVVERPKITSFLDVAAREILGMVLQAEGVTKDYVYDVLTSSYPFRNMTREKFEELVKYLVKNNLLVEEGEKLRIGKFFFKLWNFSKNKSFTWSRNFSEFFSLINSNDAFTLKHNDNVVGEIDAIYVYKHIRVGDVIRVGGKLWKIIRVNSSKMSIDVVPADSNEGEIPVWRGDGIPKSYLLPRQLEKVLRNLNELDPEVISTSTVDEVKKLVSFYVKENIPLPSRSTVIVERRDKEMVYSTLVNEKVSNSIAHLLLYLSSSKDSLNSYARASVYGFSISADRDLLEDLVKMDERKLKRLLLKAILRSPMFFSVLKEIQVSFGKIGKIDLKEDRTLVAEALKQTITRYFSVKGTLNFIAKVKRGEIKVLRTEKRTPLAEAVLLHAPIKPWLLSVYSLIYESLKGGAYTISELSEQIGIPEKSLENKLKQMRKPSSKYRITSFIDVDSGETRWCVMEELPKIVESDDYYTSFTVLNDSETFIAILRQVNGDGSSEIIFKPKDLLKDDIRVRIPYEEIAELRIADPVDPLVSNLSPRFYYVNKKVLPYLLLNAVAYIQNLKYS